MANTKNYDPSHENFYTRLGLDKKASSTQIKRAFFNAVKVYPPEKDQKNHKLIREAYDSLIHPISKSEYDTKIQFGSVLDDLEKNLQDSVEAENIDEQIIILKKILNLAPDLGIYRNKLGNAFMEKEQFGYAYNQFKKAHNIDSENLVYILNMGHAETERGNYVEAEKHFIQAWDLDREDHSAPRALASLYFEKLNRKRKAHNILDEAIEADAKVDFQDFFCIYDKVHFYALDKNQAGLKRELERIKDVSSKKEEKEFASFMLYRTGGQLFDLRIFDLAVEFLKTAHLLSPNDSDLENFYNECRKQAKRLKSIENLLESDDIHDIVKALLGLYAARYYDEISEAEFKSQFEDYKEIITNVMDTDPDSTEVKDSLKYVRQYHKKAYNLNSGLFDLIIDLPPATSVGYPCPYCGDNVRVSKHQYDTYNCPHCYKSIEYDSRGYTKATGGGFGSGSSGGGSDWCFIATAVYENSNHPQVLTLRKFRDEVLETKFWSRKSIEFYYKISPPIAGILKNHRFLSGLIKVIFLNPLVQLIRKIMKY
jgi:hypothetical protein